MALDLADSRGHAVRCRAFSDPAPSEVVPESGDEIIDAAQTTRVREIMSRQLVCVRQDVPRVKVEELLRERNISGCPVVDQEGQAIGVISRTDLLEARCAPGPASRAPSDDGPGAADPEAASLMTPLVVYIRENASVAQAAALMAYERIHRLAVISGDGTIVGVVTTLDVSAWLARQHGYAVPL
jgi:CBS domain-containing protein